MEKETLTTCPGCASSDFEQRLECTDHFITGEIFAIDKCRSCGLLFTNPRPSPERISHYYDSSAYVSHSKTASGLINYLFHLSRRYTLSYKRGIVKKYSTGNSLLDYGCGTGDFLRLMQRSGFSCKGIEPNQQAREKAIEQIESEVYDEDGLQAINKHSLDAISLWHVLEHIYPLADRIRKFHELLKDDGTLFIAVPNHKALDAKIYGAHWAAWDVPRHIYHFDHYSITSLMHRHGFILIKTRPMMLDAFYISLLSQKYKSGKQHFFLALINGLRSNFSACFSHANYSSIIYIFKKSK